VTERTREDREPRGPTAAANVEKAAVQLQTRPLVLKTLREFSRRAVTSVGKRSSAQAVFRSEEVGCQNLRRKHITSD